MLDTWDEVADDRDRARVRNEPGDVARRIRHALRGLPFTPDEVLTPVQPIALADGARHRMEQAAVGLVRLIEKVCWSLSEDPVVLRDLVGLTSGQVPLLNAGGAGAERSRAGLLARPDVVFENGRPRFLECNFGTADIGPVVARHLTSVYRSLYRTAEARLGRPGTHEPYAGRARLFRRLCEERGMPPKVAVVGTMREENVGDSRYFETEARYLRDHGFASEFFEPEELEGSGAEWPVVVNHFIAAEWQRMGISLEVVQRLHQESVVIAPDAGMLLSSKLVLAWLSAGRFRLTAEEEALVAESVPWTRRLEPGAVVHDGREQSLPELAVRRRAELVLKPVGAFGGRDVVLGRSVDPAQWRSLIEAAVTAGTHIVQELVRPDPMTVAFHDAATDRLVRRPVSYVLGPYVVDGAPAGYMVRHAPSESPSVVNFARGASFNLGL
ncbi:hypothetical protein [Streptomyces sp. NBC_00239]|uniref:hypothetical protein n=1 Tax=Streptomyces sp. NBC_00239 TaxID=2903640 RepID=UPI002E291FE7|nr:hypothetical protein [Streptomyces sp. NBC_00239]